MLVMSSEVPKFSHPESREKISSNKVAVLWNGQTSYPGIGETLFENSNIAQEIYNITSDKLGVSINSLQLKDPDRQDTQAVQYANAPYNYSIWHELNLEHPNLHIASLGGHSFGEAFSTVPAGAVSYENFLKFLVTRTELMRRVNEETPGALMALTARKARTLEEAEEKRQAFNQISKELQDKFGVEVAIYASTNKQTIGGKLESVHEAVEYAKKLKDYVVAQIITTNGAPHTSLYLPIVDELRDAIRSVPNGIKDAKIPIVTCSKENPEFITKARDIEDEIVAQATQPVYGDRQHAFLLKNGFDIIQIGEKPIIAQNAAEDFGEDVEMEKVESHTKRNIAIGVGGALVAGAALTLGWKVTHKNKSNSNS